jgi:hypothetical protein
MKACAGNLIPELGDYSVMELSPAVLQRYLASTTVDTNPLSKNQIARSICSPEKAIVCHLTFLRFALWRSR